MNYRIIKSQNPKRWRNVLWAIDQQDEAHIIALSNYFFGVGGFTVRVFPTVESDGLSINEWRTLASALEFAIGWVKRTTKKRGGGDGVALDYISAYDMDDAKIYTFPVFLRDKNRAVIFCKIYTDETHGGSVVIWGAGAAMSDLPSVRQYMTQILHIVNFATTERAKFTRRA